MVKKIIYTLIALILILLFSGHQIYETDIEVNQGANVVNEEDLKRFLVNYMNDSTMCRTIFSSKDNRSFRLIVFNYDEDNIKRCSEAIKIKIIEGYNNIKVEREIEIAIGIQELKSIIGISRSAEERKYIYGKIIKLLELKNNISNSKVYIKIMEPRQLVHKTELIIQILILVTVLLIILTIKKKIRK
ncbi:hypothetical protein [Polynucleobacter sphagniphilus]|jgi:translation elongation factor EF-1beta|uniref:Translation elongation factor EF-1beta n=1 Tax=Polynucleobacter sphagniphilus TaxID=1743169 RepID=A0AA43MBW3_9BURK|nr:hypothetical protein [Polynucleobacter sphagniphilus]MDH6504719.1 translation elongation factor EF-1beta [Polynucleobacter sphagniphilus]MDH6513453.1 translation elongation factor EF-1beta [Polynucleobacter sphagniphilus]